jgi:hypothetical protein
MAGSAEQRAWVERVLGFTFPPPGTGKRGNVVNLAQGLMLWNQTRASVAAQVARIQAAILADTANDDDYDEIVGNIGALDEVLDVLDDRLTEKLNEIRAAADETQKNVISDQARKVADEFAGVIETDELIGDIDNNGFVASDIKLRLRQAITVVRASISGEAN